ncbi:hypothetical protein MY1884_000951 [Beauveria asiatica]
MSGDSETVKRAVMKQVLDESNLANARTLIEVRHMPFPVWFLRKLTTPQNIGMSCFERCITNPGDSLSKADQTCVTSCMEKYMAAWNHVNAAFITRVRRE